MLRFICFIIVKTVLTHLDYLLQFLLGFNLLEGGHEQPGPEFCAKVSRVIWRSRPMYGGPPKKDHFILKFKSWTKSDIILDQRVTCFDIDQNSVHFAQCDVNVHQGAFIYDEQFKHCTNLITIPLESFVHHVKQWREKGGKLRIDAKVAVLSNTGRCGSTLLSQILHDPQYRSVSISEPGWLTTMSQNQNWFTDENQLARKDVIRSCLDLMIHSASANLEQGLVLIKQNSFAIQSSQEILEVIPEAHHLYLIREPVGYLISATAMMQRFTNPMLEKLFLPKGKDKAEMFTSLLFRQFADQDSPRAKKLKNAMDNLDRNEFLLPAYVGNIFSMLNITENLPDRKVTFFTYKDLLSEPETTIQRIFDDCGHDVKVEPFHLPTKDSQESTAISRENLKQFKKPLTPEQLKTIDRFLNLCDLPKSESFPKRGKEVEELFLSKVSS